ncbi:TRAP transporter fused permease subunit [Alcaligenaceae bacterium]|nr:TRAP transporter fused permease subunit [Alcaligenaceae bacterium]
MANKFDIKEELSPQQRNLQGNSLIALGVLALLYSAFHFYTAATGPFQNIIQRSIHVSGAMILVFLFYKPAISRFSSDKPSWLDYIFMIFIATSCIYLIVNYDFVMNSSATSTMTQIILGWGTVILLLEAARRVMGIIFPALATLAILYGLLGPYFPGAWSHRGIGYDFMIEHLYLGTQGLWGITTAVTSTTVAIFIIFGVILMKSGASGFLMNLSLLIAGRTSGGPAKVAVLASSFFSMLSGSAPANVAVTGNITIPMMKRLNYDKNFAGAVEATASTGGQLAPPIMGAGAFLMAEFVGVSYVNIVIAATIPALLFYVSVFFSVHWKSVALGYKPLEKSEIPSIKDTFILGNVLVTIIPVSVLVIYLFGGGSAARAGFYATITCIAIYIFKDFRSTSFKTRFLNLVSMFVEAGKGLILIAILAGAAQIIVGLLSITGLGIKLSDMILGIGDQSGIITLFLAMIICIILGMGMPTTAAYLLASSTLASTLVQLGYDPLASHMFLFYFAVISAITPPVCVAVFVACGISQGDWLKTSKIAVMIGFPAFIIPYIFINSESLLLQGETITIVTSTVTTAIGIIIMSAGLMGNFFKNLSAVERLIIVAAGFLLILPGLTLNLVGGAVAIAYLLSRKFMAKLAT